MKAKLNNNFIVIIALNSEKSKTRFVQILSEYSIKNYFIETFSDVYNYSNEEKSVFLTVLPIERGFTFNNVIIISENDLFPIINKTEISSKSINKILKEQSDIKENDLVIHVEYGLGKFIGLENVKLGDVENDFLKIEYANNSNLFVPIEDFNLISKYSDYDENVKLDNLGNNKWDEKKQKLKKKLKEIAKELISLAGKRKLIKAPICIPPNGEYEEFCLAFPFVETEDQLKAIADIEKDLARGNPMDRLLCGDVAFGKTEVAMRAAFIVAASRDKQVAIISPTTILARQHYSKFQERFKITNINICSLSRVNTDKENKNVKKLIEDGKCNIVIGTHALLNKDINFKNLAMVIVDEEQRFGVKQKEKLKELKNNCHFLSMSATPIPRTLQMSIIGIRDLSLLTTPPRDRINISTFVSVFDDIIVREAIYREIYRNGGVFFVVPRIKDIEEVISRLNKIVPDVNYNIVHGQMDSIAVDKIMNDFYDRKFSILIATNIIENGIDIPFVNTVIIYKANNFGLSQLYQIRGRVGRSNRQAYCYLTTKPNDQITENAKKRLEIMDNIEGLNAGFRIASEDMEIRGSGNIIGEDQSGFIRDVGVELYNQMLKDAVVQIKKAGKLNEEIQEDFVVEAKLGISTVIPEKYINNLMLRMKYYRLITDISSFDEKNKIKEELTERFGSVPITVDNLLRIALIKARCLKLNISKIEYSGKKLLVNFYNGYFKNSNLLINYVNKNSNFCKFNSNSSISFFDNTGVDVLDFVESIIEILEFK